MKKKALALLMSLLLAASLSSVAFADGAGLPAPDDTSGLIDVYGQAPVANPAASEGQTAPPEVSSQAPESSAPESSSSAPESSLSEPEVESSAPESTSSTPESTSSEPVSSEPESTSSEPESSEPESTSSEPVSSEPESSSSDNENPDNINVDPPENIPVIDDIPYEPEDTGDIFSARAMSARVMSVPIIPHDPVSPTTLENPPIDTSTTKSSGDPWIPTDGIPDVEGATISASTKLVFAIPDNNFVATSGTTGSSFDTNLANMNAGTIKGDIRVLGPNGSPNFTPYFDAQFVRVASTGSGRAYGVQLTPKNIPADGIPLPIGTTFGFVGQSSKFGLSSALLIVPGNSSSKATDITDGAYLGANYTWVTRNGSLYTSGLDVLDDAKAGDEFLIYFSPQFFEWDGNTPAKVTLSNIRSKISLRQTGTTSSRVFETVELTSSKGEAAVRIKFKDNLSSVKPVDFKTTIYLTVKGKRHDDSSLYMEGTFGDEEPEEFYSEDKDIDISDGVIGEAKENISMAKVYIGEGVTLTVPSIRKNSKFYGTVSMDFDKHDEALVEKYPDIIMVYKLHTLGLNGAGVKVDIDTYNGYHIYDKDLNYLGQTALKLPYSETYYLAASMLDLEEEAEEEEFEPEDIPIENDNPPSNNPNKNPGTGRR